MKMKHLVLISILFNLGCSTAKPIQSNEIVKTSLYGEPENHNNIISVYFTSGINDSLLIKQNGIVLKEDFFRSEWSTSFTGKLVKVDFRDGREIQIVEKNSAKEITVKLKVGYRIIELSKSENQWAALYTNEPLVFE